MPDAEHSRVKQTSTPVQQAPGAGGDVAHAYPRDLALLVQKRWAEVEGSDREAPEREVAPGERLPTPEALERLLSVCYQASLLQEEGRPVTFRIALAEPETFAIAAGPPAGLHCLVFARSRPLDEHELRRLAPAAVFQRSLVGVHVAADGELRIWGLLHSGPRWLQAVRGGRRIGQHIPLVLMIAVTGPGRVLVSKGTRALAGLASGTLANVAIDAFEATWLAALFGDLGAARGPEDAALPAETPPLARPRERAFGKKLALHVMRRIVATIRGARHGGTLIVLPAASADRFCTDGSYLTVKYPFRDEEPRRRIQSLAAEITNHLGGSRRRRPIRTRRNRVGWVEYEATADPSLAALDEALFEVAHLVATLANVDGAVVLTGELEILGFGAEISGALPAVELVDRSLDLEGTERISERTDRVGTRHRSAYRLCQTLHEALLVVVSQDGGVRFIRWQGDRVTYFDQIATGPWEV